MDYRTVEIYNDTENKWIKVEFSEIKKDDKFRLFESTGEPVKDEKGNTEFIAESNVKVNEDGIMYVDTI